jgi:hypothetical protein
LEVARRRRAAAHEPSAREVSVNDVARLGL